MSPSILRCTTCDEWMNDPLVYVPLTPDESIGVCRRCVVVIHAFCTMQYQAQNEYRPSRAQKAAQKTRPARKTPRKVTRGAAASRGRKP